ncbi:MAG: carbohydrate-binding protein, partial [Blautia stercoris]
YMAYHSRILEREMGVLKGYRSTNIDRVTISEDGTITPIQGTEKGVAQVGTLNPYERQMASTMAVMAGIRTAPYGENSVRYGSGDMIVTGISTGSWIGIYGASFGSEGAQEIQFEIRGKQQGKILVYMDIPEGKAVAEIEAAADSEEEFGTVAARLAATVTGTHDIFFVFEGEGYELKSWKFC